MYLFKKSKKVNQRKTLEKFKEIPTENKLDQQIEKIKKLNEKKYENLSRLWFRGGWLIAQSNRILLHKLY